MKKAYAKPTATKVDFEYKDHVIAQSGEQGTHGKPTHPEHCQYTDWSTCLQIYNSDYNCKFNPASLNL